MAAQQQVKFTITDNGSPQLKWFSSLWHASCWARASRKRNFLNLEIMFLGKSRR